MQEKPSVFNRGFFNKLRNTTSSVPFCILHVTGLKELLVISRSNGIINYNIVFK